MIITSIFDIYFIVIDNDIDIIDIDMFAKLFLLKINKISIQVICINNWTGKY